MTAKAIRRASRTASATSRSAESRGTPTAEKGEEERRRDQARSCAGRHSERTGSPVRRHSNCQNQADRREETKGVPVPERHRQPVAEGWIQGGEMRGKQPGRQRIPGHSGDAGKEADDHASPRRGTCQTQRGRERDPRRRCPAPPRVSTRTRFRSRLPRGQPIRRTRHADEKQSLQERDPDREHEDETRGSERQ